MQNNFRYLRKILADTDPPCVPYVGVYLSDIIGVFEGNPDTIEKKHTLINFTKRQLLTNIIRQIIKFQKAKYNLIPVTLIQNYLSNAFIMEEEELYNESIAREDRSTCEALQKKLIKNKKQAEMFL